MDVINGLKKIKNNWSFKRLAQELGIHEKTLKNWFLGIYKPSSLASERIQIFLKNKGAERLMIKK